MIGIYKITNKINQHCYIGQSRQIEKRWKRHIEVSNNKNAKEYQYPLYKAFRKYGIKNFLFEIIEECTVDLLNEKENYYIKKYKPEYNQTEGGDYQVIPQKLTYEQVKEIQQILINDKDGLVSHKELGEKYGVSGKDTIRDINVGRTWHDSSLSYPLHQSRYSSVKKENQKNFCCDCGKEILKTSKRCYQCEAKQRSIPLKNMPITREELKNLIRNESFVQIGERFNVTDNAIRKWCDKFNLPRKKADIKKYSDEDWKNV